MGQKEHTHYAVHLLHDVAFCGFETREFAVKTENDKKRTNVLTSTYISTEFCTKQNIYISARFNCKTRILVDGLLVDVFVREFPTIVCLRIGDRLQWYLF